MSATANPNTNSAANSAPIVPQSAASPMTAFSTVAPAAPQSAAPATRLMPPHRGVRVRMYRQGLGDCFLLAFPGLNDQPFYMLIDCGVIKGTVNPQPIMQAVAEDILAATGGLVHVLAATHEHWDHLSGFLQAQAQFDQLDTGQVWMAWTEDPNDALATSLRQQRGSRVNALQAAVEKMNGLAASGLADPSESVSAIQEILGFFGDGPEAAANRNTALAASGPTSHAANGSTNGSAPEQTGATIQEGSGAAGSDLANVSAERINDVSVTGDNGGPSQMTAQDSGGDGDSGMAGGTTAAALAYLKAKKTKSPVRYCRPGEPPIDLIGDGSVRVYVLGPPHDTALLKRSNPTQSGHEVYELSPLTQEKAFAAAAIYGQAGQNGQNQRPDAPEMPPEMTEQYNRSFPFDQMYHVPYDEARLDPFFTEYYGFDGSGPQAWRRIDGDWLEAAGQLALQLDSDTNNTSLALAFEFNPPGTGKVLLFPGDAQVGNWLSWQNYSWPESPAPGQKKITANDLMARTVLYKVGHHGSHNATLQALGLEQMTSPELVAMIPVNHAMAEKKHWDMPFGDLYAAIQQRTNRRVMRIDDGRDGVPAQNWHVADDTENPRWTDLYIEYTVEL